MPANKSLSGQATTSPLLRRLKLLARHSGAAFYLGEPLVAAPHGLPRYQRTSRLIAAIARQPLIDSVRSPDASVVRLERWQALSEAERDGFPPLCPDLVVELAAYMANGASLGWLLLPQSRTVEVWKAGAAATANSPLVFTDPAQLEAGTEFPGLVIDPRRIWEV